MSNKIKFVLIILAILIIGFITFLIIFKEANELVLEHEHVLSFQTEEHYKNNRIYLLVSGHCGHSSLNIGEITEILEDRDVVLRVYTTVSRANNKDGSFLHAVKIDDNIDRVLFGDEKKVIWQRSQ